MLKLGSQSISAARLGGAKIRKAYLGDTVVFDTSELPVSTYAISASIDPAGSGTVSGAGTYQAGETVTVTATPGDGYKFAGWQENGVAVSEDEAYSFTVTGDRTLTAIFEAASTSRLPTGYTELQYVTRENLSLGDIAYAQIPVYLSDGVLEANVVLLQELTSGGVYIYYCAQGTSNINFNSLLTYRTSATSNGFIAYGGDGATNVKVDPTNIKTGLNAGNYHIVLDTTGKTITINGLVTAKSAISEKVLAPFIAGSALQSPSSSIPYIGFGEFIITNKNKPDNRYNMHLIPCENPSGKAGFYDLISEKFYGSANKGLFIAGPAV